MLMFFDELAQSVNALLIMVLRKRVLNYDLDCFSYYDAYFECTRAKQDWKHVTYDEDSLYSLIIIHLRH